MCTLRRPGMQHIGVVNYRWFESVWFWYIRTLQYTPLTPRRVQCVMRPVATDVAYSVAHTGELYKNAALPIEMPLGAHSCGSKEPCIRWGSRLDESIRRRKGWQNGDATSCQITLDTCYRLKEPIMELLYEAKNGVHAFGYSSAESEPIWVKSGTMWANCWGLALADTGRNPRSSNSLRGSRKFFFLSGK